MTGGSILHCHRVYTYKLTAAEGRDSGSRSGPPFEQPMTWSG